MEIIFNFEKLNVYQKSLDFVDEIYVLVKKFPKEELYGLSSQYKRAALSISLNIGEGQGSSDAQFNRYLNITLDSLKECVVCSTVARRQNYISEQEDYQSREKLQELAKMIQGIKKFIKNNS
ncbi:four helix bundle protein [uncultured Dokdonia sp.]|uniref:four helix bundle protein n=1 Tax=uncultured Dokdonia sp. TaxID=575653 RepID=UPI002613EE96|nr:four helix bundle protein [uncultured Dokdonia sp.]